ncbi:MAG: von Willebrand factor type A domain-containing protein, partial [Planctomycetota bacterium]
MSDSHWNDPRITAYALGELSDEQEQAFESELANCPELQAAVDEVRLLTGKLESHFAAEEMPVLEPSRREQVLADAVSPTIAKTGSWRGWLVPGLTIATAASFGALMLAPQWNQDRHLAVDVGITEEAFESENEDAMFDDYSIVDGLPEGASAAGGSFAAPSSEPRKPVAEFSKRPSVASSILQETDLDAVRALDRKMADSSGGMGGAEEVAVAGEVVVAEASQPASSSLRGLSSDDVGVSDLAVIPVPAPTSGSAEARSQRRSERMGRQSSSAEPIRLYATEAPSFGGFDAGYPVDEGRSMEEEGGYGAGGGYGDATRGSEAIFPRKGLGSPVAAAAPADVERRAGVSVALPSREAKSVTLGVTPRIIIDEAEEEAQTGLGRGPGEAGDRFEPITDNPFKRVSEHPLSTFSVDVDTASYSKVREYLRQGTRPRPDAVRIEEMVNYFQYDYAAPDDDAQHPYASNVALASCPWNPDHQLARIAIQGKTLAKRERPQCNLVFLLDTSGSMNRPNKLPLLQEGMKTLIQQLPKTDRVAIVTYAGSAGLVLDSTKVGKGKKVRRALTQLGAGGSTNGGAGIQLAYQTARDHFIDDGVNRVILCTDGDFNV